MEKQVLSKEEIETLSSLQQEQNDLVYQLGQVEYQLGFFDRQKNTSKNRIRGF
jgi:hypothetical protein